MIITLGRNASEFETDRVFRVDARDDCVGCCGIHVSGRQINAGGRQELPRLLKM
jgi:hypothetical protein